MCSLVVEDTSLGKDKVLIFDTTQLIIVIRKFLFSSVYTIQTENCRVVYNRCSFLNIESSCKDQICMWEMENGINRKL